MKTSKIANTNNFFEMNNSNVEFWGLDIAPRKIPLTKEIKKLAEKLGIPFYEVVEIYDDKSLTFFKRVYKSNSIFVSKTFDDSRKN